MSTMSLPRRAAHAVAESPVSEWVADAQHFIYAPVLEWARRSPLHSDVLGHSLHPVLTDLTLGCWSSASLLDVVGGPDSRRAATLLVNEQGYRGASVDKISAKLNVTKGSFYHHNDNKEDLISECFERTFSVVRQALSLAESSSGSGWDRACAAARALVRYQLSENGPLLRSSATSALPDQAHRDRVIRTLAQLTERMASVVVDGMMDGSIRPLDPSVAAQLSVGLVNAAAELTRWVPNANPDNAPELYVRPIFLGILCAPSRA